MPKGSYIYCDANLFHAYFNGEEQRIEILEQLFEEVHKDSQRKIVTSVMSITEVSHVAEEKARHRLNPKQHEILDAFWADSSLIELVDCSEVIARQARDLIRQATPLGYVLRTNDAIHLVSARFVGAKFCFTYDKKLHKFSGMLGCDIRDPFVDSPKLPFNYDG